MSLLEKFVDSLVCRFDGGLFVETIQPFEMNGVPFKKNTLIFINQGKCFIGPESTPVLPGSFYFTPSGSPVTIKHGAGDYQRQTDGDYHALADRTKCFRIASCTEELTSIPDLFTCVKFDLLLYDAIPFFDVMGLPPFSLPQDREFEFLVRHIVIEQELDKLGRSKMISNYLEEIIIHLCRYIDAQSRFNKYVEKLQFLTDRRLVDIVHFVKENLEKDLSNKKVASVAFVSEDYVGQFFKSMTGQNLQDYIENQRLERAMYLIQTRSDTIQEIAVQVGFKDPAYFSRRFKMKFGINANAVRVQRDQLI